MAGRTVSKHLRTYIDGYDLSSYFSKAGPLQHGFSQAKVFNFADGVEGALPNHAAISPGQLQGVLDNTATSGLHAALGSAGTKRVVTIAVGDRAAPAAGVPVFCGEFQELSYKVPA